MLFAVLLGSGVTALTGAPAAASCVLPPQKSSHAFTGTVTAVAWDGRVASVTTDDGETVEVRGTEATAASATSVDRTYQVGARYEFHPLNDASPYWDNACTATHKIAGAAPAGGTGSESGSAPAAPPAAASLAGGFAVLLLLAVPVFLISRWRRLGSGLGTATTPHPSQG